MRFLHFFLLFLGCCILATAHAAALEIAPIRLNLSAKQAVTSFVVTNRSDVSTIVQIEPKLWIHQNGQEKLEDTRDLLISPPMITIPANSSQTVRVGLRRPPDPHTELSYRIFLQEVAVQKPKGEGLNILLRIGFPVYVAPIQAVRENLNWQIKSLPDKQYQLALKNQGNVHVLINELKLAPEKGSPVYEKKNLAVYVPPGELETWTFSSENVNQPLKLEAITDRGTVSAHLVIPAY